MARRGMKRKGKFQALIVEKKGGVASWIRLGLDNLGLFLEGLNLCILDEKASGWGREWKEQGRTFSMSRGTNIAGEFIRLGVFDLARKHFCIFVPRGRKETGEGNAGEEDDLEKLGQHWAKSWELKGSLGLAKMEKGRGWILESKERVLDREEKAKEIWVRLFGLPVSFWSPEILKKAGDACGGFITADEPTKTLGELQWARILVRSRGDARPSVLEVEVEEEVYEIALWWECRPVIRRSSSQAESHYSSEVGGEGTGGQRAVGVFLFLMKVEAQYPRRGSNLGQSIFKPKCQPKGPSGRPDEVGCSITGPVSTPIKGPSSKEMVHSLVEVHQQAKTNFIPEVGGLIQTDKALEEESMRYGKGMWSWGNRVLGIPSSNSFNFDRTPGVESFGHSGDWNEGVRVDNSMWLTKHRLGRFIEWKAVNAEGASGGILVCWDKRSLEVLDWEEGQFTLSCRFRNVENGVSWIFTGVYGPFSKMEREALWDELGAIRGLWEDPWCIGGDFNITLFPRERSSQRRMNSAMRKFAENG
ncbi:hypothetical protein CK203_057419 [Vitis vinifera]|uniref:Uncharacterized protein n=1 Tax=Vitis vinifera TaxID=29760 RepID=A0A438FUF4_VITVI|nr:hypothetical protein CK203_057419 [Vitis vinifera]